VEPTRLQKERKAKEQLAEKHINISWEKELEGVEIYCQRQEKVEGIPRQPIFLMEQCTLYILILCIYISALYVSSISAYQQGCVFGKETIDSYPINCV
jgi:hypothetical protein